MTKEIEEFYRDQEIILGRFGLYKAAKRFTNELKELKKDGVAYTEKDIAEHRKKICEKCIGHALLSDTRCPECHCFLQRKIKFNYSRCPIDKWGEYESITPNEYIKKHKI